MISFRLKHPPLRRTNRKLLSQADRRTRAIQLIVRAIAIRRIAGLLTSAKPSGLGFFSGKDQRLEFSSFVLAIAEWLLLAQAAGAIGILLAGNQLNVLRGGRGNFGQVHNEPFG